MRGPFRVAGGASIVDRCGEGLHPSQVPNVVKAMARCEVLPEEVVSELSAHSAGVGTAQDMIASGIELSAIVQARRVRPESGGATSCDRGSGRTPAPHNGSAVDGRRARTPEGGSARLVVISYLVSIF